MANLQKEQVISMIDIHSGQLGRFKRIIQDMVRTWRLYWFLRYIDKCIKAEGNFGYLRVQNGYKDKRHWEEPIIRHLWDVGIQKKLFEVSGDFVVILDKGEEWLEGKYILYGLIRELWEQHKFLVPLGAFVAGVLTREVIELIKLIF